MSDLKEEGGRNEWTEKGTEPDSRFVSPTGLERGCLEPTNNDRRGRGAIGGLPTQSPNRTHPLRLRWLSLQGTQSVGPTEWTEGQEEPAGGAEGPGPKLAGPPAQRALTWGAQQGPGGGGRQPRTNSGIQDGAGLPGRGRNKERASGEGGTGGVGCPHQQPVPDTGIHLRDRFSCPGKATPAPQKEQR